MLRCCVLLYFRFLPPFRLLPSNATFQFNFRLDPSAQITILEMQNEEGNKKSAPRPLQFTNKGGDISFTCIFYDADEFPITIFANGKALITYMMEVTE